MTDAPATKEVKLPTVGTVEVSAAPGLKNWRMVIWGLALAIVPAAFTYLGGVDWTQYFDPTYAAIAAGVITLVLRFFSNGPIGSNVSVSMVKPK
jgi:hypothetical protein